MVAQPGLRLYLGLLIQEARPISMHKCARFLGKPETFILPRAGNQERSRSINRFGNVSTTERPRIVAASPMSRRSLVLDLGRPRRGKNYPTVFIYGWVNNVLGIWRSDDHCVTWTQISDGFPTGSFDLVKVIEGDNNTYGKVYVGFAGSGYAYGTSH